MSRRLSVSELIEPFYPILLGFIVFLFITKGTILNPTYVDWLMQDGDSTQHWLGWQFFRHSPLLQWPLGANPNYGMEIGSSIVFSDSIPLLAFIFKPLSALLPETFQYIGLWILMCFCLQSYFAWKLLRRFTTNKWLPIIGCVFFALAPAALWRLHGHNALFGHWVLLAGLYLYFSPNFFFRRWFALLLVTALIHAYLLAMVLAVYLVDLIQRCWSKQLSIAKTTSYFLVSSGGAAFIMWVAGYFMVGQGVASEGFGLYRMNLLSLFDPDDVWSKVLRDQAQGSGDYEGFNFLGLGVIALGAIACYELLRNPKVGLSARVVPIFCLSVGLFLYAVSNHVAVGAHELLSYDLPSIMRPLTNAFRASGRFFWPAYYVIYLAIFWVLFARLPSRVAIVLCASMLFLQLADMNGIRHRFRDRFAYAPAWSSPLRSAMWEDLARRYKKILVVLPHNASPNWAPLSQFAAMHRMAINIGYFARIDSKKEREAGEHIVSSVLSNTLDSDSLYVFQDDGLWKLASGQISGATVAGTLDGFRIIAPDFTLHRDGHVLAAPGFSVETSHDFAYGMGRVLFTPDGVGRKYTLSGWSQPEVWGTWSDGNESYLQFTLNKPVNGDLELLIEGHAFITERHPSQTIDVLVNRQYAGTLKYDLKYDRKSNDGVRTVTIPKRSWSQNNGRLLIQFRFKDAISPSDLGLSSDGRRLGLGMSSIELKEKAAI